MTSNKKDFTNNSELINSLIKGDKKAYSYLVNEYNHKLCIYANSLVNDSFLAEDIVQTVFVKVWERRIALKANYSIKSFLYKSVYNQFIDEYRKKQNLIPIETKHINALNNLLVDGNEISTEKIIKKVMTIIDDLPPKCKQTFLLSKKEGLSNIEISEYLNVSVKAVEAQVTKAYNYIRKNIGEKTDFYLWLIFKK